MSPNLNLNNKLLIPFIAPPNGGKGTQTQRLSAKYQLPTFDMGATFRAILKEGKEPALKAEIESFMNSGKLVPVEIVAKVFQRGLEMLAQSNPQAQGFILDGFPRNQDQAEVLLKLCEAWGARFPVAIYLNVPLPVVRERATGRRFCSVNGREVYNVNDERLAPKQKKVNADGSTAVDMQGRIIWLCDFDQAELIVRADDEPETVEKRLKEYQNETDPLIEYLQQAGLISEIDGQQSPEMVTEAIEAVIQPLLSLAPIS